MTIAPVPIESVGDPRVDVFRDVRDRDLRGREGLFMAESELVLRRLLDTPERLHAILLVRQRFHALAEAIDAAGVTCPVYVAGLDLMARIAGFHVHRGVLAVGRRLPDAALGLDAVLGPRRAPGPLRLVLAEGLTNVDNMGALFRNAAAFGADGVVLDPTCCDPLYRKAVRVSMGHVLAVPYVVADDWMTTLRRLRSEWAVRLLAAEASASARPVWELPHAARVGIVLGAEGAGLRAETLAACDGVFAVPMASGVPSLNVATASAVFLYELSRKVGF